MDISKKLCPACSSYLQTVTTSLEAMNHKKCPTCGWYENEYGTNLYLEELKKLNLSEEEMKERIVNWRKYLTSSY